MNIKTTTTNHITTLFLYWIRQGLREFRCILTLLIFTGIITHSFAVTRYVKTGSSGSTPYTSWATASNNLQTVINYCNAGDTVWVATGTYQPGAGTSFIMKAGVKIFGGFVGTETSINERDWATNVTILQGNGSRVIYNFINYLTSTSVLDGFTITGGSASYGGGINNYYSSPLIRNVIITGNVASTGGGGIYNNNSSPVLINALITDNTANTCGGVLNYSGNASFTNVTIVNNGSGGLYAYGWTNWKNCIIWDDIIGSSYSYSNSLFKGLSNTNNGNIDATGLSDTDIFIDPDNGDYSLNINGPAINSGDNNIPQDLLTDILGNLRIQGCTVDLGAYESDVFSFDPQQLLIQDPDIVCSGSQTTFTVEHQNGTDPTYTWYLNGVQVQTGIDNSYIVNSLEVGDVIIVSGLYDECVSEIRDTLIGSAILITEVDQVTDRIYCNNDETDTIHITGDFTGMKWINDNPSIGLPTSGNGDISSFIVTNTGSAPQIAHIQTIGWNSAYIDSVRTFDENGRRVTYTNVKLNNASNTEFVSPGSTVNLKFDATSVYSGYCDNCFYQQYIGIGSTDQTVYCYSNLGSFTEMYSCDNDFTAPNTPGVYYLTFSSSLDIYCMPQSFSNVHSRAIAVLYVGDVIPDCSDTIDFTTTVNPTPDVVATPSVQTICTGNTITTMVFSGNVSGTNFNWTRDNTTNVTGIAANGSGNISGVFTNTTNTVQTTTFTITPVANACTGTPIIASVNVRPLNSIIYVDLNNSNVHDGTTWITAFNKLEDALSVACTGDQIWVAKGTYQPESNQTYTMKEGVKIYGGFENGDNFSDRDWVTNSTIFKGNGNSVFTNVNGLTSSAELNGFTITDGIAFNGGGMVNYSYCSPALTNLIFENNGSNLGGAVFNEFNSSPVFTNVTFRNNQANKGGGVYNTNQCSPTFSNTIFESNSAVYGGGIFNTDSCSPVLQDSKFNNNFAIESGGGVYNERHSSPTFANVDFELNNASNGAGIYNLFYCSPILTNVVFVNDTATLNGGGISNSYFCTPTLTNVVFENNLSPQGGGIYNEYSSNPILHNVTFHKNSALYGGAVKNNDPTSNAQISNSVFWENLATIDGSDIYSIATPEVNYSYTQSNLSGPGNIHGSINPFANSNYPAGADNIWRTGDDGLQLKCGSSAINAGNNDSIPNGVTTDINGDERIIASIVDMGAYELLISEATATPSSQISCSGMPIQTIALTGSVPGTSFFWAHDNLINLTGIAPIGGGDISGVLTNNTSIPQTTTFTIIPSVDGCNGTPITATVTVYPTPGAVATPSTQSICSGTAIQTIVLSGSISGTTFDWTRDNTANVTGIASSGSGDISGTLTNLTNTIQTVTFTIAPTANGCSGTPITATVTVNPTPLASANPTTQTICSGNAITTISFSGNVSGTTFNWTRDNTANVTDIASSGSGDISGSLTNTTNTMQTTTFTITPTANGCSGAPITATVTVNPTPNVSANPTTQTICSGNAITTIVFSGNVSGTTFNWTRDNTANVTGIASNGSGDISGSLTNTTNMIQTITFTITPTANGCSGAPITATVTVNPIPNASANPTTQTICSGSNIQNINLSGNVSGTTYSWTRANTANVTGIASNGSGDISGTLTNLTNTIQTVTFTITPTANGCVGLPLTTTVTVNPTPNVSANPTTQTICSGNAITTIVFNGEVSGTTFSWTRDNTANVIGIASNGSGDINGILTNTTNTVQTVTFTITPIANGCIGASITATVTVNPLPTPTATVTPNPVCTGHKVYFTSSGGVSYIWSGPDGFSSYQQNPFRWISSVDQAGTYIVSVTNIFGCSNTTSVNLEVNESPHGTISASPNPICEGETLQLFASGGDTYLWSGPLGYTSTEQNPTLNNFRFEQNGIYKVIISNNNGCSQVLEIRVKVFRTPYVDISFERSTACLGSDLHLYGKGIGYFSWTGPNGFASTEQNPVISGVTALNSGLYTLTVFSSNGCSAKTELEITIKDLPTLVMPVPYVEACEGSTVQLLAKGEGSFSWSGPWGFASPYQNPLVHNIPLYMTGNYIVTLSGETGCISQDSMYVNVGGHINGKAWATPNPVCQGSIVKLHAEGGDYYMWTGPGGFYSNEQEPVIYNMSDAKVGLYSVLISNKQGCQDFISFEVNMIPIEGEIWANANPNPVSNQDKLLLLSCSSGVSYSWTGPNGFTSSLQNPIVKVTGSEVAGIYVVTITLNNGCTAVAKVAVRYNRIPKGNQEIIIDGQSDPYQSTTINQVFPNPTNNMLYLSTPHSSSIQYSIFSPQNKIIVPPQKTDSKNISVEELSSGVYYIRWKADDESEWTLSKFVKIQ